jgi:hypothetical protein
MDEKYKILIIFMTAEKSFIIENAEVPLYPTLQKMILKRQDGMLDTGQLS